MIRSPLFKTCSVHIIILVQVRHALGTIVLRQRGGERGHVNSNLPKDRFQLGLAEVHRLLDARKFPSKAKHDTTKTFHLPIDHKHLEFHTTAEFHTAPVFDVMIPLTSEVG